jgi:hypothetical protein
VKALSQDNKYAGFKVLTVVDMKSYISEDRTFRDNQWMGRQKFELDISRTWV